MCFFPQRAGRQWLSQLDLEEEHLRALDLKKKKEKKKKKKKGKGRKKQSKRKEHQIYC